MMGQVDFSGIRQRIFAAVSTDRLHGFAGSASRRPVVDEQCSAALRRHPLCHPRQQPFCARATLDHRTVVGLRQVTQIRPVDWINRASGREHKPVAVAVDGDLPMPPDAGIADVLLDGQRIEELIGDQEHRP